MNPVMGKWPVGKESPQPKLFYHELMENVNLGA